MNDAEIERRLREEPYFINIRRFNYDIRELEKMRYPDGAPTHVVAQALHITEEEVHTREAEITTTLQEDMGAQE